MNNLHNDTNGTGPTTPANAATIDVEGMLLMALPLAGFWEWDIARQILNHDDLIASSSAQAQATPIVPPGADRWQNIHRNDVPLIRKQVEVLLSGRQATFEYRRLNTGETNICHVTAILRKNEGGDYALLQGANVDVSRHKEAEVQLLQTNDALEQTERMANLGNWRYNLQTGKFLFSGNLYKIFGVADNDFKPTYEEFVRFAHPDDRHLILSDEEMAAHPEEPMRAEYRVVTEDGIVKRVKSISKLYTNSAGERIILGTIQDNTGEVALRNQLEENASLNNMIIENSVDFISAYDPNLRLTAWNNMCEVKTGLKREAVLGKHILEIFEGAAAEELSDDLNDALSGRVIRRTAYAGVLEGQHEFFISPLRNASGIMFGVLCVAHDQTAIKSASDTLIELNRSLKQKNEELERSNNELASFSYVASHDLQEPLRKIQTFSNRIMEKELDTLSNQAREYLKRMESAAARMQTLIDDLLAFSRTTTQPREFKQTDLNAMLQQLKAELKESIDEKSAVIEAEALPVANVIGFQFHQLLVNLLLNALKYNKPGVAPHIKITCRTVWGPDVQVRPMLAQREYYELCFVDNGIGFDPQYNEKIFELFQRLHGRSEYPGTGLGLAICRKIMHNHEGMIVANGVPGVGATFSVYFPV